MDYKTYDAPRICLWHSKSFISIISLASCIPSWSLYDTIFTSSMLMRTLSTTTWKGINQGCVGLWGVNSWPALGHVLARTHIHTYTCTDIYIKIIHYSMIKAQHLVYDSHLIKTIFNCDINAVIRMIWILNKQPNIVDDCVPCWVPRSNCCWFPHIRSIRSLILHILLH